MIRFYYKNYFILEMRNLRHRLIYVTVVQLVSGSWNLNSRNVVLGLFHNISSRDWGIDHLASARIITLLRLLKDDDIVSDALFIISSYFSVIQEGYGFLYILLLGNLLTSIINCNSFSMIPSMFSGNMIIMSTHFCSTFLSV